MISHLSILISASVIINEMELLRQVWQDFKDDMQTVLTEADYEKRMKEYMASGDYRETILSSFLYTLPSDIS